MATLKQIKTVLNYVNKNTRPILKHVKVDEDGIICTDLETIVHIKSNMGLSSGLHYIKTLELLEGNLEAVEDYPLVNAQVEVNGKSVSMSLNIIESLLPFTSKDETRPHLNGIAINAGHFVATDGYTLKHIKCDSELECIIPSTSLKILVRLLKLYKIKDSFNCDVNDDYFTVSNEHFTFKARLIQRDFAKWQAVIPRAYISEMHIVEWIDYKELKPLFDDKHRCTVECKNGEIVLRVTGHDVSYLIGTCKADMDVVIGFNVTYIERAAVGSRSFKIKFNNALAPCEINEAIVMPMKV